MWKMKGSGNEKLLIKYDIWQSLININRTIMDFSN